MKKEKKKFFRFGIGLTKITREDLVKIFNELVHKGEVLEKDRDKFISNSLENFKKKGRNVKKKIINAVKTTVNPNREDMKKMNKRINELVKEIKSLKETVKHEEEEKKGEKENA